MANEPINVEVVAEEDQIIVSIGLAQKPWPSSTGKSLLIASTKGAVPVKTPVGTVRVNLTAYQYPNERED